LHRPVAQHHHHGLRRARQGTISLHNLSTQSSERDTQPMMMALKRLSGETWKSQSGNGLVALSIGINNTSSAIPIQNDRKINYFTIIITH
jgi:hypothetical protein